MALVGQSAVFIGFILDTLFIGVDITLTSVLGCGFILLSLLHFIFEKEK